jgi:hypothetical protein
VTTDQAGPLPGRHLLLAAAASGAMAALTSGSDEPRPGKPAANPEDASSIDALLAAIYDVISGPKGKARDWARMRGLFVPGARLIPCRPRGADGKVTIGMLSVEDYIARSGPTLVAKGFVERQVARRVERFGHLAQVFSTYETRLDGEAGLLGRGINAIHLLWDETRWWVVMIMWDAETPAQPIPAEYEARK